MTEKNSLEPRITFPAPATGIVTEVNASEGQYVSEGTTLYKTEDAGSLWVEADLYPTETALIKVGDNVAVQVSGESTPIEAKVTFLSPEFRNNHFEALYPDTSAFEAIPDVLI